MSIPRRLKTKLLEVSIAAAVGVPLTVGATISSALPVHADCYYSGSYSETSWNYSQVGAEFASTVTYTLGYDCYGDPTSIIVTHTHERVTFTGSSSWVVHQTVNAHLCNPWDQSTDYCGKTPWPGDFFTRSCKVNCTLTRDDYPNKWMPFKYGVTMTSQWLSCDPNGIANCQYLDKFCPRVSGGPAPYCIYGGVYFRYI
jgi:hypothetical protein